MASFEGRVPAQAVAEAIAREGDSRYEDRLTEVLAIALELHPPLAGALMDVAGFRLATEGVTFRIRTQRAFRVVAEPARVRSTDLEIVALQGDVPVARLWCESKLDSAARMKQLDDQFDALHAAEPIAPNSRLLAIVPVDRDRHQIQQNVRASKAFDVNVLTWLELNDLIRTVGMRSAGTEWPDSFLIEPETTESWSVLCELQKEIARYTGVLASEPVTHADLTALAQINETGKRLQWLLWQVFDSALAQSYERRSSSLPRWRDGYYYGVAVQIDVAASTVPCWIDEDDIAWTRYAAICANSDDGSSAVLEVGVWAWAEPIRAALGRRDAWAPRLDSSGFKLEVESEGVPEQQKAWLWREEPLFDVLEPGVIAQRDGIAVSVSDALRALEHHELAPKRRSRPSPG